MRKMLSYLSNTCWYLLLLSTVTVNVQASTLSCKLSTIENDVDIIDLFGNTNLKDVKILRKNLVNIMKLTENMINILDEWAFDEISNITESEKFNKENYNLYKTQVDYLHRNYSKLSEELPKVNTSDGAHVIKTRNIELKTELDSLKSNFDEKTMKSLQLASAYLENDNIVNKCESLCNDIDVLIEKTVDKEESIVANTCIEMIRKKDFEPADNLLNQITDYKKISYIVNKTYSSINFYKILNFTNHITNLSKRYHVLNELNKEMRVNGHMTLKKVVALVNSLSDNIINIHIFDSEITPIALDLRHLLKTDIESLTMLHLGDVLQGNDTIKDCDVKVLTKIFSIDSYLVFDIFYQYYMHSDNNSENVISKFQDIFKLLLDDSLSNARTLFHLIESIQNFFVKIHYSDYADRTIEFLQNKEIPEIIKNALFAERIGLVNHGWLRCSSDLINNTYRVYDHVSTSYIRYEYWILKKNNNIFKIRSYPFENFYLDIDEDDNVILNKETSLNNGLWKLEIKDEKHCAIKNLGNNKYLYTSTNTSSALTKDLDLKHKSGFFWQIRDLTAKTFI